MAKALVYRWSAWTTSFSSSRMVPSSVRASTKSGFMLSACTSSLGSTSRAVNVTVRLVDCTAGGCWPLPHSWQRSCAKPFMAAQHWPPSPSGGIRTAARKPTRTHSTGAHPPRKRPPA
ncbi:hypothetical protein EYF80_038606 [Liparis tanakae]|uniref:Uncharacterized protein n=1 Tax=Liparis tanakae TaxID=230148 RepID=A0A4Z2GCA4_9TELE|nr:hypothetical protein EYF80_038606 [Liparis tanakae]